MYKKRIDNLLKKTGGLPFIDCKRENIYYFSGFTGDSGIIILSEIKSKLITYKMFEEQALKTVDTEVFDIVIADKDEVSDILIDLLKNINSNEICFSPKNLSVSFFGSIVNSIKNKRFFNVNKKLVSFKDGSIVLGNITFDVRDNIDLETRMVKSREEIEIIKSNITISDEGFLYILNKISDGVSEKSISAELEYYLKLKGADNMSFETIVASGERSSIPHGVASDKIIRSGEPIVIDFGIKKDWYCTDTTRTVFLGKPSQEFLDVYNIVRDAMYEAISFVKEGVSSEEVHKKARNYIEKYGYGDYFIHSTGHGVGLEIHELPRISKNTNYNLLAGMIHTVEPGIYLPGKFGVRIENMVLVTKNGAEILQSIPDELMVI